MRMESSQSFHAAQYAARGAAEFAVGRFQDAAVSYSAVATSQPRNPDALYNLALCLERCERWDAAAAVFENVLRLDAGRGEAQLALASCLLRMNRAEEALAKFDDARDNGPHETALFGKAVALQLLKRFEEAAEIYASLLSCAPHAEEVLGNWIAMAVETQDLAQVQEHARRLLKEHPESLAGLRAMATVALTGGDHNAAASLCERLLDQGPESLEAWHNLRIALGQLEFGPAQPAFTLYAGGKR